MSQGMLGLLPLSQVRGPRNTLDERLAGKNGPMWLKRLNHMLREQMTVPFGDGQTKEALLAQAEKEWDIEPEARAFILSDQFRMATEPGECDFAHMSLSYAIGSEGALDILSCDHRATEPTEEDALRFAILHHRAVKYPAIFLHKDNLWKGEYVLVLMGMYPFGGRPRPLIQCVSFQEPTGKEIHKDWHSWQWGGGTFLGRRNYEGL
jgi:hypothetical protein